MTDDTKTHHKLPFSFFFFWGYQRQKVSNWWRRLRIYDYFPFKNKMVPHKSSSRADSSSFRVQKLISDAIILNVLQGSTTLIWLYLAYIFIQITVSSCDEYEKLFSFLCYRSTIDKLLIFCCLVPEQMLITSLHASLFMCFLGAAEKVSVGVNNRMDCGSKV